MNAAAARGPEGTAAGTDGFDGSPNQTATTSATAMQITDATKWIASDEEVLGVVEVVGGVCFIPAKDCKGDA